jgi:D-arabinose 1-dehydrogenase-like Zn-dependent alcohol dehydrogenase
MIFVSGNAGMIHVPVAGFMLNQIQITGSVIGSIADLRKMIEIAHLENIGADIELFPLNQVNTAINKLKNNELRFRAVLDMAI